MANETIHMHNKKPNTIILIVRFHIAINSLDIKLTLFQINPVYI